MATELVRRKDQGRATLHPFRIELELHTKTICGYFSIIGCRRMYITVVTTYTTLFESILQPLVTTTTKARYGEAFLPPLTSGFSLHLANRDLLRPVLGDRSRLVVWTVLLYDRRQRFCPGPYPSRRRRRRLLMRMAGYSFVVGRGRFHSENVDHEVAAAVEAGQ